MPYGSNYSFVIDSSFQPFSMQEMLVPFSAYKEAFEKSEEEYQALAEKAGEFEYLANSLDPDSQAAQIYRGYADDLKAQANDLSKYGLGMGNRRALMNLKRRYSGEIGRLSKADEALKAEKELRRKMSAADPSMLYAADNLNIDDFLDNKTPNLYGISGNELYARGANLGKAISSRIFDAGDGGSTLGGYYRDWVSKNGVSQQSIAGFMARPEVQAAINNVLAEKGVTSNLSEAGQQRARQAVVNGMYEGIVYNEQHNPVQDAGVLTAAQKAQNAISWAGIGLQQQQLERNLANDEVKMAQYGYKWNPETKKYEWDEQTASQALRMKSGKGSGSGKSLISKNPIIVDSSGRSYSEAGKETAGLAKGSRGIRYSSDDILKWFAKLPSKDQTKMADIIAKAIPGGIENIGNYSLEVYNNPKWWDVNGAEKAYKDIYEDEMTERVPGANFTKDAIFKFIPNTTLNFSESPFNFLGGFGNNISNDGSALGVSEEDIEEAFQDYMKLRAGGI